MSVLLAHVCTVTAAMALPRTRATVRPDTRMRNAPLALTTAARIRVLTVRVLMTSTHIPVCVTTATLDMTVRSTLMNAARILAFLHMSVSMLLVPTHAFVLVAASLDPTVARRLMSAVRVLACMALARMR